VTSQARGSSSDPKMTPDAFSLAAVDAAAIERVGKAIAGWVRAEAENRPYAAACEWRNVADAIECEAEPNLWLCGDCKCLNGMYEAFCWRCGAGPPEDDAPGEGQS
jgi:hypothetical protein